MHLVAHNLPNAVRCSTPNVTNGKVCGVCELLSKTEIETKIKIKLPKYSMLVGESGI